MPRTKTAAAENEIPRGQVVYLLCFDQPYGNGKRPRHYIGWTPDLEGRVNAHRRGQGARLLEVVTEAGIGFTVARIWPGGDRCLERKLKNRHNHRQLCPCCRQELADQRFTVKL